MSSARLCARFRMRSIRGDCNMATIGTVDVGAFALPDGQPRIRRASVGTDAVGDVHVVKIGTNLRDLKIILRHKTNAVLAALEAYLWDNETQNITITPDSHVDLGAGTGAAVTGKWMDPDLNPLKVTHDAWDITLTFRRTG